MTDPASDVVSILLACETAGPAPPYPSTDPGDSTDTTQSVGVTIPYGSEGGTVVVVSDLHLAAGKGEDGRYDGCENFFTDEAFRRFVQDALRQAPAGPHHTLIINGDAVDFLRVTYVPGRPKALGRWHRLLTQMKIRSRAQRLQAMGPQEQDALVRDFEEWRQILERVGVHRSVESLIASIGDKEELYGLKTHDFKSVLRLAIIIGGHPEFFEALADWLESGHRLVIVKGNHDLEWFWLAVRNYLRLDLAERIAERRGGGGEVRRALLDTVLPSLTFVDHSLLIDEEVFVEHGHPYDATTRVIGSNTVNGGEELNIPFGSFFNRYLLNFLERDYPFLDNIRPTPNILPALLKQDFLAGLRLLLGNLAVIAKTVPRGYVNYIFGQHLLYRVFLIVLSAIVPSLALAMYQLRARPAMTIGLVEWVAVLFVTRALIQALAQFQLSEPDSLAAFARLRFAEHGTYRLITFGHTHNPDQFEDRGRWFYNTGTWMPIVETGAAGIRMERTFMFLRLENDNGTLRPGVLERWDDQAGRAEPLTIIRRGAAGA